MNHADVYEDYLQTDQFDGVIGLNWKSQFIDKLFQQKVLGSKNFYLQNNGLRFGNLPPSRLEKKSCKLKGEDNWNCQFKSITLGNKTLNMLEYQFVFQEELGEFLIISESGKEIMESLLKDYFKYQQDKCMVAYQGPHHGSILCENSIKKDLLPDLILEFQDFKLSLNNQDMFIPRGDYLQLKILLKLVNRGQYQITFGSKFLPGA